MDPNQNSDTPDPSSPRSSGSRVTDAGAVVWGVRFHRPEVCFREAFTEACTKAQRETDLPMFYGAPEKV